MNNQQYEDPVKTDLSQFGFREIKIASKLLNAYVEQPDILGDGVQLAMNVNSGYVFLTDEDYRVVMMDGDKLKEFFSCPEDGHEGFKEEFKDQDCEECKRIFKEGYFSG
jgi:hypothetical protein